MKRHGCLYVGPDAKNLLDFALDPDQADERRSAVDRIDQDVEITVVGILSVQYRAEDAWITCVVAIYGTSDGISMRLKGH